MIFRIAGLPPRNFYQTPEDRVFLPAKEAAHALLESVGTLRSTATGETSNLGVVLRQSVLALYATRPPLGQVATLTDGAETIYAGTVVSLTWTPAGLAVELEP